MLCALAFGSIRTLLASEEMCGEGIPGPAFQCTNLGAGDAEDDEFRRPFSWHSEAYFRRC
jgi:hypothetical protein